MLQLMVLHVQVNVPRSESSTARQAQWEDSFWRSCEAMHCGHGMCIAMSVQKSCTVNRSRIEIAILPPSRS